jgi:Na+/melibiose symporter-like transporter
VLFSSFSFSFLVLLFFFYLAIFFGDNGLLTKVVLLVGQLIKVINAFLFPFLSFKLVADTKKESDKKCICMTPKIE